MKKLHLLKTMLLLCALIVGSGTMWAGASDKSDVYTSNVTLSTSGGTSASTCKVKLSSSGTEYNGIKCGTSSVVGAMKLTVPKGAKYLHVHLVGWKGETVTVSVTPNSNISPTSFSLTSDDGITSNSPFTLKSPTKATTDYYKVITFTSALDKATEFTFSATSGKRFVIWGVNSEEEAIEVESLSVNTAPTKTRYEKGETLNMTGFSLDADGNTVTSGYTMKIDDTTVTSGSTTLNTAGKKTIVVSYGGKTVNQNISVGAVQSISITTAPTKISYDTGDSFDATGMVVTASLSTGEVSEPDTWTKPVTGYTVSPEDNLTPANKYVTITYAGQTTKQAITVTNVAVTAVSLKASTTIEKTKTETLTPTFTPANATNKAVSWESSNTSVATVTSAGVVTGVAAGTANITVTTDDGGKTATCVVTVVNQKGGKDAPFTVAEVRNGDASGKSDIWVKGYIVGSWKNNKFDPNDLVNSNLALADSYDSNTTIPVELTDGSGLRTDWGPASNSYKVGVVQVLVKGNGQNYFGVYAIKGTSEIEAVAEAVKVTAAGYATKASDNALDFSGTGITAYTATDETTYVKLHEITSGQVPANTPVVLYKEGADGTAINVPVIASADDVEKSNDLNVVGEGGLTGEDNIFVLSKQSGTVGFYLWDKTKTLNEGKIYLKAAASAREFLGFGDDETTGIKAIDNEQLTIDNYYDLSGRKVAQPTKGLYIVNGKKVVVK